MGKLLLILSNESLKENVKNRTFRLFLYLQMRRKRYNTIYKYKDINRKLINNYVPP